jgi:hypothetical protein
MAGYTTVTISGDLLSTVRTLWRMGVAGASTGKVSHHGLNVYTEHALAAYVTAVAAVEAFVNESFLETRGRWIHKSALWELRADWLERLELQEKLFLITHLQLGKASHRGEQPLQDFLLLARVRNEVVHYKYGPPPKFINEFLQRRIAMSISLRDKMRERGEELHQPWAWDMSCTEGIRWAHNASCRMVQTLVDTIPLDEDTLAQRGLAKTATLEDFKFMHSAFKGLVSGFREITDAEARALFLSLNLNPDEI